MADQAKITLRAPGSTATLDTRDETQAANLEKQGWTRVDESAAAKKATTGKAPAAKRTPAAKKPATPATDTTADASTGTGE